MEMEEGPLELGGVSQEPDASEVIGILEHRLVLET